MENKRDFIRDILLVVMVVALIAITILALCGVISINFEKITALSSASYYISGTIKAFRKGESK